jgi:hypothetical protein
MELGGKQNNFYLDTFYHQLRTNCSESGIQRSVIDRYIGQVEEIRRKDTWKIIKREMEDAQNL